MSVDLEELVTPTDRFNEAFSYVEVKRSYRFVPSSCPILCPDAGQPPALLLIPDMHMGADSTGNFQFSRSLFRRVLDYAEILKDNFQAKVVQLGDMYELWQGTSTQRQIDQANRAIVDRIKNLRPVYLYGNHDRTLSSNKDRQFRWHHGRVYLEHGFTPDVLSNELSWAAIPFVQFYGLVERIVGGIKGEAPEDRGLEGAKPYRAIYRYYMRWAGEFNRTRSSATPGISVIGLGHTHNPTMFWHQDPSGMLILLDSGACLDGRCFLGLVTEREVALCEVHGTRGEYSKTGGRPLQFRVPV